MPEVSENVKEGCAIIAAVAPMKGMSYSYEFPQIRHTDAGAMFLESLPDGLFIHCQFPASVYFVAKTNGILICGPPQLADQSIAPIELPKAVPLGSVETPLGMVSEDDGK